MTDLRDDERRWTERAAGLLADAGHRRGGARAAQRSALDVSEHEIVVHGTCRSCTD